MTAKEAQFNQLEAEMRTQVESLISGNKELSMLIGRLAKKEQAIHDYITKERFKILSKIVYLPSKVKVISLLDEISKKIAFDD